MAARLTTEIVNNRLIYRNIKLVGEYVNNRTMSTFTCKSNHTWLANTGNVLNGSGCPICWKISKVLTKADIDKRLADNKQEITMTGDYVSSSIKCQFTCSMGHTWETRPASVLISGCGCPVCNGTAPLSKDVVNDRLDSRGISLISDYIGTRYISTFMCLNGHTWKTTTGGVLSGLGCPCCSEGTSDGDLVYIMGTGVTDGINNLVKFGISSNSKDRLITRIKSISKASKSVGYDFNIALITNLVTKNARKYERKLLSIGEKANLNNFAGYTEFRWVTDEQLNLAETLLNKMEKDMDYFDYTFRGITFEMGIEVDEDADMPHWTDIDFCSDIGEIEFIHERLVDVSDDNNLDSFSKIKVKEVLGEIELSSFTKETQELIRKSAYEQYQEKAKRDYETEGCDAYHRMKDDANA